MTLAVLVTVSMVLTASAAVAQSAPFSWDQETVRVGEEVRFTPAPGLVNGGYWCSYQWGDGTSSDLQQCDEGIFTHTWSEVGDYGVVQYYESNDCHPCGGSGNTDLQTVTVHELPAEPTPTPSETEEASPEPTSPPTFHWRQEDADQLRETHKSIVVGMGILLYGVGFLLSFKVLKG